MLHDSAMHNTAASFADGSFVNEYEALSALIQEADIETVARDKVSQPSATPSSIGPKDLLDVKVAAPKARKDPKDIWDDDEVTDVVQDDVDDGREAPSYEFIYKQAVGAADTFLGMSSKDPSSTSCEDMVLRVDLPGVTSGSEVDLDVKPSYVKLSSARFKLAVYLPHKVDADKSKAQWDAAKHMLSITLRIVRDEDFL